MRKIISAFFLSLCLPMMADTVPGMVVTMSTGDVKEYVISNIDRITYLGSDMVISTISGSNETISTDDISRITLAEVTPTGIAEISSNDGSPVPYIIYTMDGMLVAKGVSNDGQLPLNALPTGKYLININGKTIKVVK